MSTDPSPRDERLSALIDGELSDAEAGAFLARAHADGSLREQWDTYHLIGDALRGTTSGAIPRAVFAARLAQEPTILAPAALPPRPVVVERSTKPLSQRPTVWMSAAAGVAAAGFVGWVALPNLLGAKPQPVATAPSAIITVATPAAVAPTTAPSASSVRGTPVPTPQGVDDYLIAHQRFSSSSAMQGAVPYVRLVGDERREARP